MYNIGDKFKQVGRIFGPQVFVVIDTTYNKFTMETLYVLQHTVFKNAVVDEISEDTLNKDYIKI